MSIIGHFLLALSLLIVTSESVTPKPRQGRGLFQANTVTVLVEQRSLVTETAPSSCVVVEPSLPPCRHVRQIGIDPTATRPILQTEAPQLIPNLSHSDSAGVAVGQARFFWSLSGSQPTPQAKEKIGSVSEPQRKPWAGWDGWFFDDVTLTQTIVHHVTKRVEDPNMVVKFSVKGCEPTRLPFDLPKCNETAEVARQNPEDAETGGGASISKDIHYVPVH